MRMPEIKKHLDDIKNVIETDYSYSNQNVANAVKLAAIHGVVSWLLRQMEGGHEN